LRRPLPLLHTRNRGLRAVLNETRDRQILFLRSKGLGVDEIADRFGISRRTVFRVIGSAKAADRNQKIERDRTPIPIRPQQQQEETRKEAHCA
jgi:transposase